MFQKSQLDKLLKPEEQFPYHRMMRDASFFTGINPHDQTLQSRRFLAWKRFQIVFMLTVMVRLVCQCFQPKGSPRSGYLGDFKVWWGEPYLAKQVVWMTASVLVPTYQYINLCTVCGKDIRWTAPFRFIEGLATPRDILLQDAAQVNKLHNKMKQCYFKAMIMKNSLVFTYSKYHHH